MSTSENKTKKILFVASLGRNHILKFHVPTIKAFTDAGWIVDVACAGDEPVPYVRNRYTMSWQRSPFNTDMLRGIRELKKILNEEQYDIVYCHTPVGGVAARLAARKARRKGTKVVYFAHGLHFYKGAPLVNWLAYYPVEKILSYLTDVLFVLTREDYETAKKHFSPELEIDFIPGIGIDFERLKVEEPEKTRKEYRKALNIPEDAFVMIYPADIVPNKNQRMLIDTLKILRERNLNAYLLLPGPECDSGACEKYANEQGVEDFCRFLGWRNDIGELMYTADVFTASSIREGFSMSPIEAMYCGIPVVATDNRGHRVIQDGKTGFLVKVNDVSTMVERIMRLANDDKLREKLSHQNMESFDCQKVAKDIQIRIERIADRE